MLANTVFLDDKAILNLFDALSSGESTYYLALAFDDIAFKAKIRKLENGKFKIDFDVPKTIKKKIEIEDFFAKPAVLSLPKPYWLEDFPNFNIILLNTDIKSVSAHFVADDDNIPTHVEVTVRGFRTFCEEKAHEKAKHTALFRFNPQTFSPQGKGIIYDITTNINQNAPLKNAVSFQIKKSIYLFYFYIKSEEEGYFVVKSQDEERFSDFIEIVDSVRSAYALINGYYMADRAIYVSRELKKSSKLAIEYKCENSSIYSQYPLLDYNYYQNLAREELLLTSDRFGKLVNILAKSSELRRSCVLITQSACLDNISNGCLASVAIETITGYFTNNHFYQKPKLFDDKNLIRHIKYELEKVVKGSIKYAETTHVNVAKNVWEKLKSKLGQFNEMPNALKLSLPYEENNI